MRKQQLLLRSAKRNQTNWVVLWQETLTPFFTNFIDDITDIVDDLADIGTAFSYLKQSFESFNDFTQGSVVSECLSPLL